MNRGVYRYWLLIARLCAAAVVILLPVTPAAAYDSYTVSVTTETIEYDISESQAAPAAKPALAVYGPFHVVALDTAEMYGTVDSYSPAKFRQMLASYPAIRNIEMIDCDGSVDDEANLNLARMIRRAGISTHVPDGGSIRSGAVELFLAGVTHSADPNAEFVVHSWMDENGMEAKDFPENAPVHAEYLNYYAEMGVPADKARDFYRLTNSVPFSGQLVLTRNDLAHYQLIH